MASTPIGDYALLSDCHTAALVSRAGSLDWLCLPRFDAPAVFARLLDDGAGHWAIAPVGAARTHRRYRDDSLVLETRFTTAGGEVVLVDALAVGADDRGHDLGRSSPGTVLRRVTCTAGAVDLAVSYAPRPEYGLVHPLLTREDGGVAGRGGASVLLLSAPLDFRIEDGAATARWTLHAGESTAFALDHQASWEPPPRRWSSDEVADRIDATAAAWRSWSRLHQRYEGPWRDAVHLSGRVLQGLTFAPTGAIVAAPTTSLPEEVGGARNWDYRYTWVRDASLTLEALWVAACPDEAHAFFAFLAGAAASQLSRGEDLQIMFGIGGERDLSERELPHLAGWRGSRPVRVGNGAWGQRQLDVYGELLGAAGRLADLLDPADVATTRFLAHAADAAARRWRETDQGIWEIRDEPRHYLHSKLACWQAVDRAIALAEVLGAADRVPTWEVARAEIRAAIEADGWSQAAGAFTQAFGSDDLDASALMLPIVGFLPGDDPRVVATVDAIAAHLTDARGLVYRYRAADGLGGEEGSFLLCTFWLAHAQALAGEVPAARATFTAALAHANDLGLLAEEVDPATGELLGNYPQAFSHIGLVTAAWAISEAERVGAPRRSRPTDRVGRRAGRWPRHGVGRPLRRRR